MSHDSSASILDRPNLTQPWLILADDLTGAADCAVAFARRGWTASVTWGDDAPSDTVVAIDANTRHMTAMAAADRHCVLLRSHFIPGSRLFKKIDSTLRGQPAAELSATMRLLRSKGHRALALMAPAFPETGRTTEEGAMRLHGQALERTALWARDHTYATAHLVSILEAEGLVAKHVGLDNVRGGRLAALVRDEVAMATDVLVCDATTPADLDLIAQATLPLAAQVVWTGSGGLAQALAQAEGESSACDRIRVTGSLLFVVGSIAEATRTATAAMAADASVVTVPISPATLRAGPDCVAWQQTARQIAAPLSAGQDLLVEIAAEASADLSQGADLARRLAVLLRPMAPHIGGLFATGGETALALLEALSVTGIRLLGEIEPGVPFGLTRGTMTVPIVTKAGGFGDAGTLHRCLAHLRRLRQLEN